MGFATARFNHNPKYRAKLQKKIKPRYFCVTLVDTRLWLVCDGLSRIIWSMTLTAVPFIWAVTTVVGAITLPADGDTAVVVTSEITQRITGHLLCWETKKKKNVQIKKWFNMWSMRKTKMTQSLKLHTIQHTNIQLAVHCAKWYV